MSTIESPVLILAGHPDRRGARARVGFFIDRRSWKRKSREELMSMAGDWRRWKAARKKIAALLARYGIQDP